MFEQIGNFGDSIALVDERNFEISYLTLYQESLCIAENLKENSIVVIGTSNTKNSLIEYIACLIAKATPLLLSASLENSKLERYVIEFDPDLVFGFEGNENLINHGFQKIEFGLGIFALKKRGNVVPQSITSALLLTTSGSTGNPQVVRISDQNLLSNTESIIDSIGLEKSSTAITTLPMFYTYGLSIINTHLLAGAKIVLSDHSVASRKFWSLIVERNVTTFGGVPLTYELVNRFGPNILKGTKINSLTQAGGGMKIDQIKKLLEVADGNDATLWLMYGQTEATARMSVFNQSQNRSRLGSVGMPIRGGRFEILDQSGQEISNSNVEGDLVYYGPNVSMGYATSRKDLFEGDMNGGRLCTGDTACFDSEGFFYITGRKSRFAKISGKRFNLDDIEDWLMRISVEAACVEEDQKLAVFYCTMIDQRKLKTQILSEFGIGSQQVLLEHIDVIPRSSSGKTLYGQLREHLLQ